MKQIIFSLLVLFSLAANAQISGGVFNASKAQAFNKSATSNGSHPLDYKSMYHDTIHFVDRPFVSTAEANAFLPSVQRVIGLQVIVNTGGSVNGTTGILTGGTNDLFYYKDGIADGNLVLLVSNISLPNATYRYYNGYGSFATLSTDSVLEDPGHKYFHNSDARAAISLTTTGSSGAATYNNSTGVLNVPQYTGTPGAKLGKIEFISSSIISSYQHDSLIGKRLFGLSIQGQEITSQVRPTVYYTFDSATGTIVIQNGAISDDDQVIIKYVSQLSEPATVSGFNPDSIPSVFAWFNVTDPAGRIDTAGRIKQLTDLTGHGHHITQSSYAGMPTYDAAEGGAAAFDSARSATLSTTLSTVTGNYSVYLLVKKGAGNTFHTASEYFGVNNVSGLNGIKEFTPYDNTYGYFDGTTTCNTTSEMSSFQSNYLLIRYRVMQGNSLNFHINDECPTRTGFDGPAAGAAQQMTLINMGVKVALPTSFFVKEAVIVTDTVSVATDKKMWKYVHAKYGVPSRTYIQCIGDSHTFGIQSGTTPTGNPYYLKLAQLTGIPTYNDGVTATKVYDAATPSATYNLNNILPRWIANGNPSTGYVTFMYGTNDLVTDIADANWDASLRAAVQAYINAGYPLNHIGICSSPYTTSSTFKPHVDSAAVHEAAIAASMGVVYIDVRAATLSAGEDCNTVPGGDTIHGDDAIHATIATTIKTAFGL